MVEVKILGGGGYANGDMYELTLVGNAGMTLFAMSSTATTYVEVAGPCGTSCQQLTLDLNP
jgi:hypothetical protein